MQASQNGSSEIANALVNSNDDVNWQANNGATALIVAIQDGPSETVTNTLINTNGDVNRQLQANNGGIALIFADLNNGATALMVASQNGPSETGNADVNRQAIRMEQRH